MTNDRTGTFVIRHSGFVIHLCRSARDAGTAEKLSYRGGSSCEHNRFLTQPPVRNDHGWPRDPPTTRPFHINGLCAANERC
jgi:hypothetical protein